MRHAKNESGFYYVEIRPLAEYKTFRVRDLGEKEGIERVVGQRADGVWDTVKWLIGKKLAHIAGGKLVADCRDVQELFEKLGCEPKHIEGNRFEAKARGRNRKNKT